MLTRRQQFQARWQKRRSTPDLRIVMDVIPIKPERKAQLEEYSQRQGQDTAAALDNVLAEYLDWERRTMRSRWHHDARSMVFRVEITEEAEGDAHDILVLAHFGAGRRHGLWISLLLAASPLNSCSACGWSASSRSVRRPIQYSLSQERE